VWGGDAAARRWLADHAALVEGELNVKRLVLLDAPPAGVRLRAGLDKKEAARRLGAATPAVSAALEAMSAAEVAALLASPAPTVRTAAGEVALKASDVRVAVEAAAGSAGQLGSGVLVVLETTITPELAAEGIAREVKRRLNDLRKRTGLRVDDRVRVRWRASGAAAEALGAWSAWIADEVLAVSFEQAGPGEPLTSLDVPGHEVAASLDRA
jgi:isoleucyl-tRNA synthetase